MAMTLESAMHIRQVPWFGIGTVVEEAPTSAEAMRLAGLDWEVVQKPVYCDGMKVPNRVGNVRMRIDHETHALEKNVLGIVSPDYHPVQNSEAFDFFDSLIGEEAHYESAGCLGEGRQIFLTAKMERRWTVADDDIDTYLLLSNGHDGCHALRAAVTPIRVVCQNTLNLALAKAKRSWMMFHSRDIKEKMREAQTALGLTAAYMDEFTEFGNRAVDAKVSAGQLEFLAGELFRPLEMTEASKKTMEKKMAEFEICLQAPDVRPYAGTVWGVLNAVSDFETHRGQTAAVLNKVLNDRLSLSKKAFAFLSGAV